MDLGISPFLRASAHGGCARGPKGSSCPRLFNQMGLSLLFQAALLCPYPTCISSSSNIKNKQLSLDVLVIGGALVKRKQDEDGLNLNLGKRGKESHNQVPFCLLFQIMGSADLPVPAAMRRDSSPGEEGHKCHRSHPALLLTGSLCTGSRPLAALPLNTAAGHDPHTRLVRGWYPRSAAPR